ncbi:MAG TPA: hypothetical protein VGO13_04910 [Solirubrobacterales bacterium]|jgi:hypothetical protein|nr:hypothetical protein [Solirubrobacterales bacterium]
MRRTLLIAAVLSAFAFGAPAAQAVAKPIIKGTWPAAVGANTATLRAEIDPNGLATTYLFEYTTEAEFRVKGFIGATKIPQTQVAIGTGSVQQRLGGLEADTAYRFRTVATNSNDTTTGAVRSLRTDEPSPLFALPDDRGWEMVSPVDKNGGEIQSFGGNRDGGVIQAAAQGSAITYTSASSFANAQGSPGPNQYVSTRGESAWATDNVTLPMLSGTYSEDPDSGVPYQLFSEDLGGALVSNGRRCRTSALTQCPVENPPLPGSGAPAGYRNYYLRSGSGAFKALLSSADVAGLALDSSYFELAFAGATPDLAHVILSTCAALTANATEVAGSGGECDPAAPNLYEWSGGGLSLINVLPAQSIGTPGAILAAQSHAISANGSRVYFTTVEDGPIYLREAGVPTKLIAATVGGGASFQTASTDGSLAFFTKAGHLYRYTAASGTVTDLTPGGEVLGVLGASEDGTYLYYRTPAGLFLNRNGSTTLVAAQVDPESTPPTTGNARLSADGHHLLFLSTAELSAYDNRNVHTGVPEPEAYLFAAPGTAGAGTVCVSCNPSGERPIGPASLPGASPNGAGENAPFAYKPRVLSADSKHVFFDSFDALAVQDTNGDRDVYQWEAQGAGSCARPGGCVNLISSGRAEGGAGFLDASADGSDAFFLTDGPLVPSDTGAVDVYDARSGGGYPVSTSVIPCVGDACQALPPSPEAPPPGSLRSKASGNLPPARFKPLHCKKNQIKKLGRCVKKERHHKKQGGQR